MKNISLKKYSLLKVVSLCLIVVISLSFCNTSSGSKTSSLTQNQVLSDNEFPSDPVDPNINTETMTIQPTKSISYDLDNPDETFFMPAYLKEISGLAYLKDENILCIQDESAEIFVLSIDKKGIINNYRFGGSGDYEDIAINKQTAYVLRSDGRIYSIENFDKENRKTREIKTPLSSKNDAEGLCYDEETKSLLIACKGEPSTSKEKQYKGYRAIYSLSTGDLKFNNEPVFLINLKKPVCFKDEEVFSRFSGRDKGKSKKDENNSDFEPSGISIHPLNKQIYIISSTSRLLLILDRNGKIINFRYLNKSLFAQPEGICFSPTGTLFISNEGKEGKGNILRFNMTLQNLH